MNTTITPPSVKHPMTCIVITPVEGPGKDPLTFSTWRKAEEYINRLCADAPQDGSYWKTDFSITWADGETYEGRYDAAHPHSRSHEGSLAQHCLDFLTFRAGLRCPNHLTQAQYDDIMRDEFHGPVVIAEATRFLKAYSFVDSMVTPQLARELVAELHQSEGPTVPEGSSASESAGLHRAYVAKHATPMLPVVGNSYPVKNVLYAWGGRWDGTAKTWLVPAYKHAEAQAMVDKHTKQPVAKAAAAPLPQPAPKPQQSPTKAPQQAPTKAPVKAKPAAPAKKFRTPIQKRYDALIVGIQLLAEDLPPGFMTDVLIYLDDRKDKI